MIYGTVRVGTKLRFLNGAKNKSIDIEVKDIYIQDTERVMVGISYKDNATGKTIDTTISFHNFRDWANTQGEWEIL